MTNVQVIKPTSTTNNTSTDKWFSVIFNNAKPEQVARLWATWIGDENCGNQYSNMDSHEYLEAVLDNGEVVQCRTNYFQPAVIIWAQHHRAVNRVIGVQELPPNWVEIRYSYWKYHSPMKAYGCVHTRWTGKATIARRNADGSATVFPLPSSYVITRV